MELENWLRAVAALLFVIALMGGCIVLLRRYGGALGLQPIRNGAPRLSVVEVKMLDARHKLVLVKQDEQEHLLLLGPAGDTHIHTNTDPQPNTASGRKRKAV